NASNSFNTHQPTLLKLQGLSEQLDPCEMPYADVRFIETDWEQTTEDFENHLTNLHNEITEERGINDGINKVTDEINHLNKDMPTLAKESLIDIQEKALPPLRTEMERLTKLDTDARRNRRIVARDNEPSLNDIKNRLSELENATQQRIQDLNNLENEQRIIETRQQIDILSQQPDITEERFEQ
uniref:Tektin n=1 Tax=Panagrolaimus sp. ES5 TaxID=591445 RepID=A0AC34GKX5_9BILA